VGPLSREVLRFCFILLENAIQGDFRATSLSLSGGAIAVKQECKSDAFGLSTKIQFLRTNFSGNNIGIRILAS
jgi:hypothetical protein